eukprot:jgi/Mesen1/10382/ME000081S09771
MARDNNLEGDHSQRDVKQNTDTLNIATQRKDNFGNICKLLCGVASSLQEAQQYLEREMASGKGCSEQLERGSQFLISLKEAKISRRCQPKPATEGRSVNEHLTSSAANFFKRVDLSRALSSVLLNAPELGSSMQYEERKGGEACSPVEQEPDLTWGALHTVPLASVSSRVSSRSLKGLGHDLSAGMMRPKGLHTDVETEEEAFSLLPSGGLGKRESSKRGTKVEYKDIKVGDEGRAETQAQVWIESSGKVHKKYRFVEGGGGGSPRLEGLTRFVTGVADGYVTYSAYRAVQHCASAVLGVLSTQSLLVTAGLPSTSAHATIASWVLKDGLGHVGKFMCSSLGARMDAQPKQWRVLADGMFDVGAMLEILVPLCPQQFLGIAGLAQMAKGAALVSARATRLPIYSSFALENNLSDLYAKGEAISVLSNIAGMGLGIQLASSSLCRSTPGKLLMGAALSTVHVFCVAQEMRAAPVNTLNAERTALLIQDYLQTGKVAHPGELKYRERLFFGSSLDRTSGSVRVGAPLKRALGAPSEVPRLAQRFRGERFLVNFSSGAARTADLVLHRNATGLDAVRGWLLATCSLEILHARATEGSRTGGEGAPGLAQRHSPGSSRQPAGGARRVGADSEGPHAPVSRAEDVLEEAYARMEKLLPPLLEGLKQTGWHTNQFLESSGIRAVW